MIIGKYRSPAFSISAHGRTSCSRWRIRLWSEALQFRLDYEFEKCMRKKQGHIWVQTNRCEVYQRWQTLFYQASIPVFTGTKSRNKHIIERIQQTIPSRHQQH